MQLEKLAALIVFSIAYVCSLKQDDLIIAVGHQLEFVTGGSTYRRIVLGSYNASKPSAVAYDAVSKNLFFSDLRHLYCHIFSVSIDEELPHAVVDIVNKKSNETVESLTYDPVDKMLLWTDGFNRSIRRVQINSGEFRTEENSGVEVVHFLEYDAKPRGLISDPCTRMLYWTNIHEARPTIERSFLNGSQREIVIETDLLLPNSLDLDVLEQKLYWVESLPSGYFHIDRSFVNGTNREEIYRGVGQFIISLAVGDDYVYWSDYNHKKLWCVRKDGTSKRALALGSFRHPVMDVVVLRRHPVDCCQIPSKACHLNDIVLKSHQIQEQLPSEHDITDVCSDLCYNNGTCITVDSELRCNCSGRFSVNRCELVDEESVSWTDNGKLQLNRTYVKTLTGQMSSTYETIAKTCIPLICLLVIAMATIVKMRFLTCGKSTRTSVTYDGNIVLMKDLEINSDSFTICETPAIQQKVKTASEIDGTWTQAGDCVTLLENEF